MIVRCVDPSAWCRTWQRLPDGSVWVPDSDRPAGGRFTGVVDLDSLDPVMSEQWRVHQIRQYDPVKPVTSVATQHDVLPEGVPVIAGGTTPPLRQIGRVWTRATPSGDATIGELWSDGGTLYVHDGTGFVAIAGANFSGKVVTNHLQLLGNVYDANDNELFQISSQSMAVNFFQFINGAAGNGGSLAIQGADTQGKFLLGIKGESTQAEADAETGAQINLAGHIEGVLNNVLQIVPLWDSVNHGVNLFRMQSAVTGGAPRLVAVGPDANVNLNIGCQALGVITFGANMTNNKILRLISVLSGSGGADLNNVKLTNAATGSGPTLATEGVDASVDLNVSPKGTGRLSLTCALIAGAFNHVLGGILNIGSAFVSRGTTNPTNAINLFDGTAPVGTLANGCTIYSQAGKLWAMDSSGAATKLTP